MTPYPHVYVRRSGQPDERRDDWRHTGPLDMLERAWADGATIVRYHEDRAEVWTASGRYALSRRAG
jgi:hypothetical protein